MTKAVSLHPKKLQERNLSLLEWASNSKNLYVGKRYKFLPTSPWALPFKISKYLPKKLAIDLYQQYIKKSPLLWDALNSLDNYSELGCVCSGRLCHAKELVSLINEKKKTLPFKKRHNFDNYW